MNASPRRGRAPVWLAGGLVAGLSFCSVSPAYADNPPHREAGGEARSIKVDFVGDSLLAGEGLTGTYFDAADPRHQSRQSATAQALALLVKANPGLAVDARASAASGALTSHFFAAQQGDGMTVNTPQRDQIRPDAQLVVVGFGAADAMSTKLLLAAAGAMAPPAGFDSLLATVEPGLSTLAPDDGYRQQAATAAPGRAPTVVARLLQVLTEVRVKAPNATIVVTNYPALIDVAKSTALKEFSADELARLRDFAQRLNTTIGQAVRICGCATLADVSGALRGHELYTSDSAVNDLSAEGNEVFQPNLTGAALIAGPLAETIATARKLTKPGKPTGKPIDTTGITLSPAVAEVPPVTEVPAPAPPTEPADPPRRPARKPVPSRPEPSDGPVVTIVREVVPAPTTPRPPAAAPPEANVEDQSTEDEPRQEGWRDTDHPGRSWRDVEQDTGNTRLPRHPEGRPDRLTPDSGDRRQNENERVPESSPWRPVPRHAPENVHIPRKPVPVWPSREHDGAPPVRK